MTDEAYRWRTVIQQFYLLLLEFLQDYFWYWQKPMHDYVVLGSWYWCVIFTHKFFGFNWGQSYLATPQNFPKCFIFFNTLHIFASDQIKEEGNKIFFLSNFRHKKQFLTLFLQVFSNFWRNYWKLFEKCRETGGKS